MAGDILFHAFLPVVFRWLCLTSYWMGSRNHLAPYPGQRKRAALTMALSLDHARTSAVQSVYTCLGSARRTFYRD
jgi:hypothetical protein